MSLLKMTCVFRRFAIVLGLGNEKYSNDLEDTEELFVESTMVLGGAEDMSLEL